MPYIAPTEIFGIGLDVYSPPANDAVSFSLVSYPPSFSVTGGDLASGTILIEVQTGMKYIYLVRPIISLLN